MFQAPFGHHRAIRRFSEDIDITYDIRGFAPDLVAGCDEEALPPSISSERRWTRAFERRLSNSMLRTYDPMFAPVGPVRPEVRVDFGARSKTSGFLASAYSGGIGLPLHSQR